MRDKRAMTRGVPPRTDGSRTRDPVFLLGQATGIFIYARNLYFIRKRPLSVDG